MGTFLSTDFIITASLVYYLELMLHYKQKYATVRAAATSVREERVKPDTAYVTNLICF